MGGMGYKEEGEEGGWVWRWRWIQGGASREEAGKEICPTCMGVCCGLARELVANMANMEVGGNAKVRCSYSVKLILRFVGY